MLMCLIRCTESHHHETALQACRLDLLLSLHSTHQIISCTPCMLRCFPGPAGACVRSSRRWQHACCCTLWGSHLLAWPAAAAATATEAAAARRPAAFSPAAAAAAAATGAAGNAAAAAARHAIPACAATKSCQDMQACLQGCLCTNRGVIVSNRLKIPYWEGPI